MNWKRYVNFQTIKSPKILKTTLLARDWRYLPTNHGLPANSQVFAALIREAGFEGISYKSVRADGECLAVFPDTLQYSESRIALQDSAPENVATTVLDAMTWKQLV